MKKLIVFLWLILAASPALAVFPKPPDVPAYVDPAGTSACGLTACYAAGTTQNTVTVKNNAALASIELSDIATSQTGWVTSGTFTGAQYCTIGGIEGCTENKIRMHCDFSHLLYDDPIRNYGQPGTSHLHIFFGNERANAYSTFTTLRNHPNSTCEGGALNGSAYWAPAIVIANAFGDGKDYALPPQYIVLYYNGFNGTESAEFSRFPLGLRLVAGTSMDDPEDTVQKKEIATANTQTATTGRYAYAATVIGDGQAHGFLGWRCEATGSYSTHLVNTDGTDPWASLPGGTCPSGSYLVAVMSGPQYWDCTNLWSPGGYVHMRYAVNDAHRSDQTGPNGWCRMASIQIQLGYKEFGWNDYKRWVLSSDAQMQTKLDSLPTCTGNFSNAPCKSGAHTVAAGESMHFDYLIGWDLATLDEESQNCLGTEGHAPHQCEDTVISPTKALLSGGPTPDGRDAQIHATLPFDSSAPSNMKQIGTKNGPKTMHNMPM